MNLLHRNKKRIEQEKYTHVSYNHESFEINWLILKKLPPEKSRSRHEHDIDFVINSMARNFARDLFEFHNCHRFNYAKMKKKISEKIIGKSYIKIRRKDIILTWCRGDFNHLQNFRAFNLNFA
jgi:hypothetical protein